MNRIAYPLRASFGNETLPNVLHTSNEQIYSSRLIFPECPSSAYPSILQYRMFTIRLVRRSRTRFLEHPLTCWSSCCRWPRLRSYFGLTVSCLAPWSHSSVLLVRSVVYLWFPRVVIHYPLLTTIVLLIGTVIFRSIEAPKLFLSLFELFNVYSSKNKVE
jgi:hypothetical protein